MTPIKGPGRESWQNLTFDKPYSLAIAPPAISTIATFIAGIALVFLVNRKYIRTLDDLRSVNMVILVVLALCSGSVLVNIVSFWYARHKNKLHYFSVQVSFFLSILLTIIVGAMALTDWLKVERVPNLPAFDCEHIDEDRRQMIASSVVIYEFDEAKTFRNPLVQMGTIVREPNNITLLTTEGGSNLQDANLWLVFANGYTDQHKTIHRTLDGRYPLLQVNLKPETDGISEVLFCGGVELHTLADSVAIGDTVRSISYPSNGGWVEHQGIVINRERTKYTGSQSIILYTSLTFSEHFIGAAVFDEDGHFVGIIVDRDDSSGMTMVQTLSSLSFDSD